MNVVGLKDIPIGTIRLPGDFKKRLAAPHVAERAKSIATTGLIHEPLVRRMGKQWEVIAGLDRVAAHFVAEKESVRVKVIECTDEEARRIKGEENIQRRHDTAEQSRLALELLEKYTAEEAEAPAEDKTTPKGRARKRVAKELGMAVETVRKKEWEAEQTEKPPVAKIRSLGMTLSDEFTAKVAKAQAFLDVAEGHLKRAQAAVTAMANDEGVCFPKPRLERLREELHAQAAHVRGLKPVSLCPWCKGLDNVQEHCSACFGTGFITKSQEKAVPAELLDEENPVVMVDGKTREVTELFAGPPAMAADEPLGDEW